MGTQNYQGNIIHIEYKGHR